jgi:hypothetical protein
MFSNEAGINERSTLGGLFRELRVETSTLIQQEVELAREEISGTVEKVSRQLVSMIVGAGLSVTALVLVLMGVSNFLFQMLLKAGVSPETSLWLAPLIVGVCVLTVGYAFIQKGMNALRGQKIIPERTTGSIRENKEWIAHKVSA